ncbi:MAG: vWA domain-containing protein [Polyangiaceae bacterium]|nr:vWA domain-containing protein [Polyangiaceae bacterium]
MRTQPVVLSFVALAALSACGNTVDGGNGSAKILSPSPMGTDATPGPSGSATTTSANVPMINVDVGAAPTTAPPVDLANGGLEMLRSGACGQWQAKTEALPAVLELVVDTSGSMGDGTDNRNDPPPGMSKWDLTAPALNKAIDSLASETALGVFFYPNRESFGGGSGATSCISTNDALPIMPLGPSASPARMTLASRIRDQRVSGSTPTHDAYHFGLGELQKTTLKGKPFMLLITDGTPTFDLGCVSLDGGRGQPDKAPNTAALVAEVAAAKAAGIGTFVVGVPGSQTERAWLSDAAQAGGTGTPGCSSVGPTYCHFDMTTAPDFASGLTSALSAIVGQVVSCNYPVPTPPPGQAADPNKVNLVYTPGGVATNAAIISRNDAPGCTDGWQYSAAGNEIVLCSQTCATIKADPSPQVEVFGGCATVVSVIK